MRAFAGAVGAFVGYTVGISEVGPTLGVSEGNVEGAVVGSSRTKIGAFGRFEGVTDGADLGVFEGIVDGATVGDKLGKSSVSKKPVLPEQYRPSFLVVGSLTSEIMSILGPWLSNSILKIPFPSLLEKKRSPPLM